MIMLAMMMALGAAQGSPAPCAPGVYAVAADGVLTALPQTKADHRKVTGLFGAALLGPVAGNTMKVKTVVNGASAATRLKTARPGFRFCFTPIVAATGGASDYVGTAQSAASPRDYQLVRFEQSSDKRELALTAVGGVGGPEGQLSKSAVPVRIEELAPGQYSVTPSRDLEPGQYGFLHTLSSPASTRKKDVREQVYDFAVTN